MKHKSIKIIALLLVLSAPIGIFSQTLTTRYEAGGTYGDGAYTPFWHRANRPTGINIRKSG